MEISIREGGAELLAQYAANPIAFEVKSVLEVELVDGGLGGIRLREREVVPPYVKDYDAHEDGGPEAWLRRFDTRNWGVLIAWQAGRPVGGAVLAFDTPGVHMLAGRRDLAVLWDVRVYPDRRGRGIGGRLLHHAADWARGRGCTQLKIETQNVNVPACRFYASQGCQLGEIDRYAYAGHSQVGHEVMLIWYLDLKADCQSAPQCLESLTVCGFRVRMSDGIKSFVRSPASLQVRNCRGGQEWKMWSL